MKRRQHNARLTPQRVAALAVALTLAGAGALWQWRNTISPSSVASHILIQNAPYSVEVRPTSPLQVGETVRLHFTVKKEGIINDIYADDKVLHYVIASQNFKDFFHTFSPEEAGPGRFYLDHTFTQPGQYRIWTELVDTTKGKDEHHGEHAELVSYVDLTVGGERSSDPGIAPITAADAWAGQWHVVTERRGLTAGQPTTIRMHVEDRAGTRLPVFPAEPAIYVMTDENLAFFRHTHTQPALQNNTIIELSETFPQPGRYLFFTELYVQDGEAYQVVQVPFELTIK